MARDGFVDFVKQRSHKSQAYFAAFQDETAASIRQKAELRERLAAAAGDNPESLAKLVEIIRAEQDRPSWGGARTGAAVRSFFPRIAAWVHRVFWATVIRLARLWGEQMVDPNKPTSAASDIGQTLDRQTDLRYQEVQVGQVQNQMTNISWIRPRRRFFLRLALPFVNTLAKYAFPPGDLAGVKTVHFARWAVIDDGTGLLFEGNFDGTWENYMGEFSDRIAWGLDAVWGNTEGFPPAGMRDIWAFKRYIRDLQYPPA